jgi:hypothetical protein
MSTAAMLEEDFESGDERPEVEAVQHREHRYSRNEPGGDL